MHDFAESHNGVKVKGFIRTSCVLLHLKLVLNRALNQPSRAEHHKPFIRLSLPFTMISELRVSLMVFGNTNNVHKHFMYMLQQVLEGLTILEHFPVNECDAIIAFVPIVSRAGTDILAALERIPRLSNTPVILVSLHHTYDCHSIPPDSRHIIRRGDVFAVDCLFHENLGLLKSSCNDEALRRVTQHLKREMPPNQGRNTDLVPWIFIVLSIFGVCAFLPEGYSFLAFLIFQIFLLIIVAVTLSYFDRSKLTVWIFVTINILFIFKFLIQTQITEEDLQHG